jgi:hypothetical protein
MPTCANCHSFSADGKTFGMDIDGPDNDKGLYAVVPVQKHMSIQSKDMVHWNTDGRVGQVRVGFMSQVSPDGRYVVSTFAGPSLKLTDTFYVTNFMDYHFLQVFYPTRGILEWYADRWVLEPGRQIHCLCPCHGAGSAPSRTRAGAASKRSQRNSNSVRSLPHPFQ